MKKEYTALAAAPVATGRHVHYMRPDRYAPRIVSKCKYDFIKVLTFFFGTSHSHGIMFSSLSKYVSSSLGNFISVFVDGLEG